jgi:hypothetical protein
MGLAPVLDALAVDRAAEVVASFIGLTPALLAGRLAGFATVRERTVLLMMTAARVGMVWLIAIAALALRVVDGHAFQIGTQSCAPEPAARVKKRPEKKIKEEED